MNKKLALFFVIFLTSFAVAQKPQPANELEVNLRKQVEYLASDQLEGRKTGEAGATTAAGYVVNQFSQFKLKPGFKSAANAKASFLQPFPYVTGVTVGEAGFLNVTPADPALVSRLSPGTNYMPFANSISGEVPHSIPVVALDRDIAADVFNVMPAQVSEIEKWVAMKTNATPAIAIRLAEPLKATASMKIDLQKRTVDAYNVIGIVEGTDPVLKNETIVIGAHYDHLGRGGRSSLVANSFYF